MTPASRSRLCALVVLGALPQYAHGQDADRSGYDAADPLVLRWSARVMPGYELTRAHDSAAQGGDERERYGVFLDQARLQLEAERGMLEAELSADLADALRPETSSSALNAPPYLRDAYLGARFTKALRLRAGYFKRPFSRLERTSSGALPVRGRGLTNSLIVEAARFGDRALGLMLWGKTPGKLTYFAALSNPNWTADASTEARGASANGRIEWEPLPQLSLGADYAYKLATGGGDDDHAHGFGLDARLEHGPLVLLVDVRAGRLPKEQKPLYASSPPLAYGLVTYASYDVALGSDLALQPVLLAEYVDATVDYLRDEAVRGVVGLNLIIADGLRVMPQVELVRSLRAASLQSPWTTSESYYVMLSAQL